MRPAALQDLMKSSCPQNGGWCAYLNYGYGGQRICGFATLQQCLAEVRGVGGNCGPSLYHQRPYYQPYRRGYPIDRTIASTKVPAARRAYAIANFFDTCASICGGRNVAWFFR